METRSERITQREITISDKEIQNNQAASNQSPDEDFSTVFTSIRWPTLLKQPLFISQRVAV